MARFYTGGNDEWMRQQEMRRSSYFPNVAANKGYSMQPRFTGILQPSPTGSYYNPSRYAGEGFSRGELNRIQRNLATVYSKDLEFNRLANPNYQTTQDTGYSSDAQFGTGRASPATVQNYALKYGTPAGNGLSTFTTPSGGQITYRPSGRRLSGGAEPTVSPGSNIYDPRLSQFDRNAAYAQGYGAPSPTIQQGPGGQYRVAGGVAAPSSFPNAFQRFGQDVATLGRGIGYGARSIGNFATNLFNRQPQSQPLTPTYAGGEGYYGNSLSPSPTPYRRYLD